MARHPRGHLPLRDIVLLHGALGAASQLAALRDAIARRMDGAVTVHVLDFEGHGTAPMRDRPFRMQAFMGNLVEHLDGCGIERAPIFGFSMGGYVALMLALSQPQRVERVMTLGTKFRWTPEVAERERRMLDARRIEEKVPQYARMLAERHASGWERVLERTREMLHALGAAPELDDAAFARLSVPVRIAVGDRDVTVSVEETAGVARLLPAGELEVLPGTPHPLEKAPLDRLACSIGQFLARDT